MAILSTLGNYRNTGLLLIRAVLGIMFIMYGYPKIAGGPEMWKGVGAAMGNVGITFGHSFWGFLAALTETLGGFLLIIGFAFRPATLLLAFVMFIAALFHYKTEGFMSASHPIELGFIFIGLALIGPGKYSVDKR
ncbi:DoxX family protein [Olivibacter sp. SDN3]|uniref:DoxX family protein n=1 Tax=Olivibacter sp. SDN3 TaxID=2764720 RepID=UPI001651091F|nr:DoxX family protein [Olivibacter sp. SDN3]QNL51230.1 DoxX family protein [Olivibacter sp. SDN3]